MSRNTEALQRRIEEIGRELDEIRRKLELPFVDLDGTKEAAVRRRAQILKDEQRVLEERLRNAYRRARY